MPGGQMLGTLAKAGINANWLLTGEGEMLLRDAPVGAMNRPRLRAALEAIEEVLAERRSTMAPATKADLLLACYDLLSNEAVTREQLTNVIRFAA